MAPYVLQHDLNTRRSETVYTTEYVVESACTGEHDERFCWLVVLSRLAALALNGTLNKA